MLHVNELQECFLNNLEAHPGLFNAIESAVAIGFNPTINYDNSETPAEVISISKSKSDNSDVIYMHSGFLQYLWNVTFAIFYIYQEALEKPQKEGYKFIYNHEHPLLVTSGKLLEASKCLCYKWSAINVSNSFKEILNESECHDNVEYIRKIDAIYVWAVNFGILHEIGHSFNYHLELEINPDDEFCADEFATTALSQGISKTATACSILGAISLLVTCGLVNIDKDDKRPLHANSTHPNIELRIERIIRKLANNSAANEDTYFGMLGVGIFFVLFFLRQRNKIKDFDMPGVISSNFEFYNCMINEYRLRVDSCPDL